MVFKTKQSITKFIIMKGKLVFYVRGSEDGPLGVYTNRKLAFEAAMDYIKDYADSAFINYTKEHKPTYNRVCSLLKRRWSSVIISTDYPTAEITALELNYKL